MDTSAFASTGGNQNQQNPGQQALQANGTVPGGISSIVKALMDGNQAYKDKQAKVAAASGAQPLGQPPGMPMNLAPPAPTPPVDPVTMTGGLGNSPGITPGLPPASAMPNPMGGAPIVPGSGAPMPPQVPTQNMGIGPDPVTNALMSPIPGQFPGGQ